MIDHVTVPLHVGTIYEENIAFSIAFGTICKEKVVFYTILRLQLIYFAKRLHWNLMNLWKVILSCVFKGNALSTLTKYDVKYMV